MNIQNNHDPAAMLVIHNPEHLEVWNRPGDLLEMLVGYVLQSGDFFLCGESYSGKTSLLHCVRHELQKEKNWIPLIIDLKDSMGRLDSSIASYTFILSTIVNELEQLAKNGAPWTIDELNENLRSTLANNPLSTPENEISLILDNLGRMMKKYRKNLILLFDDAEKLPRYFPGREQDFFHPFRSQRKKWEKGIGGITCALASAEKAEYFRTTFNGSGQFNEIDNQDRIPPFPENEFAIFWEKMLANLSREEEAYLTARVPDAAKAFRLCGGRPYFAKKLLSLWKRSENANMDNPLDKCFERIYIRKPEKTRKYLVDLACRLNPADHEPAEQLRYFFLVGKPDPELGFGLVTGELWEDFLRRKKDQPDSFPNAGLLAAHIIKHNLLDRLLDARAGKGELRDWLEFKEYYSKERIREEEAMGKTMMRADEYAMHIIKAILSLRNSRGGLIVMGMADKGEVSGIDGSGALKAEIDVIREIKNKLKNKNYTIKNQSINLNLSNWNLDDEEWIQFKVHPYQGRRVVAVLIFPKPEWVHKMEYVQEGTGTFKRKYLLLRELNANCRELDTNEDNFDEEIAAHLENCQKTSDLDIFWQEFSRNLS